MQLCIVVNMAERGGLKPCNGLKRGIRAKCEMGWRPGTAPIGYINRSFSGVKDIVVDQDRGHIITEIFEKAAKGWSGRQIKRWLDEIKFTNKSGKGVALS